MADEWSTYFASQNDLADNEAAAGEAAAGEAGFRIPEFSHGGGDTPVEADTRKSDPQILIPGYVIHEQLGRGGSSVVYRATRVEKPNEVFAIKILMESVLNREYQIRFKRETQLLQKLDHPNIAKLHDYGVSESGHPYLVLTYIDGIRIDRYCYRRQLEIRDRVRLLVPLCDALHSAHQSGVLHRDIKPNNILVDENGVPYLTDFGLAKSFDEDESTNGHTRTGTVLGTLNYLAPEQIFSINKQTSKATDVFGLGATLYVLLTDRPPFDFQNFVEAARDYFRKLPVAIRSHYEIPPDLEAICIKCLAPEPQDRYETAADFRSELQRFLDGKSVTARTKKLVRRFSLLNRQYPWLIKTSIAAFLITLAAMISFFILWRSSVESLRRAETTTDHLKQALIEFSDEVRSQEDSPETIHVRRTQLITICRTYDKMEIEFDNDPELLFSAAVSHFKLGQLESFLGNREVQLVRFRRAKDLFERLVINVPNHEEGRFGLFHANLRLRNIEEATAIIRELAGDYPENLDYADAVCNMTIQEARGFIAEGDFANAKPLVETGLQESIKLLDHAEQYPRFHRKYVSARVQQCRLQIVEGDLEEAQATMGEVLEHYRFIQPLASSVESESHEYLIDIRLAFAIAAMRGDDELAKALKKRHDDHYQLELSRFVDRIVMYQAQVNLLEDYAYYCVVTGQFEELNECRDQWNDTILNWEKNATTNRDYYRAVIAFCCFQDEKPLDVQRLSKAMSDLDELYPGQASPVDHGRAYMVLGDWQQAEDRLQYEVSGHPFEMVYHEHQSLLDELQENDDRITNSLETSDAYKELLLAITQAYCRAEYAVGLEQIRELHMVRGQ